MSLKTRRVEELMHAQFAKNPAIHVKLTNKESIRPRKKSEGGNVANLKVEHPRGKASDWLHRRPFLTVLYE
ncbi:hypothetical protein TNCV_4072561 [Trichonephila clavipes]|uniref:Uncharacterized protein n=1 Tax=Trichonephila clavipes TaxID=2585209 RepID=A0A8X7BG63_TRICX|nr:hypothetical protein TNCV_4072561 [Trichonephila clavipes]